MIDRHSRYLSPFILLGGLGIVMVALYTGPLFAVQMASIIGSFTFFGFILLFGSRLHVKSRLKRLGWPREVTRSDLSSIGYFRPRTWRRVPPYDEIAIIPWRRGAHFPGLFADMPFDWDDPRAELWATLRLLDVQQSRAYQTCGDNYWNV